MTLKQYLKEKNTNTKELSAKTQIPYSTLNDIVNGKTDILRAQFGNVLAICDALSLTAEELYRMCREALPDMFSEGGCIVIRNKCYYLSYDCAGRQEKRYLCKVNPLNTAYVDTMAKWAIRDLLAEQELREWQQTII